MNRTERTRDISSAGVCFLSPTPVETGGRIEYVITLSHSLPHVHIHCLGKVLRSQRPVHAGNEAQDKCRDNYEVAVSMERYHFIRDEGLKMTQADVRA